MLKPQVKKKKIQALLETSSNKPEYAKALKKNTSEKLVEIIATFFF